MIVQLKGNVRFPITLDPTVWIFDDRKIQFERAFEKQLENEHNDDQNEAGQALKTAELFDQVIYAQKHIRPPVNKSLNRFEREQALTESFVMPMKYFIEHAEPNEDATRAILKTNEDDVAISLEQLKESLVLFAIKGKPLKEDGPIHFYFGDGTNKEQPIKSVKTIVIE